MGTTGFGDNIWEVRRDEAGETEFWLDDVLEHANTSNPSTDATRIRVNTYDANRYTTAEWMMVSKHVSTEPGHGAWGSSETCSGGGASTETETRTLAYSIGFQETLTRSISYSALGTEAIQAPVTYTVNTNFDVTKSSTYSVRLPNQETKGLGYYVKKQAAVTLALGYTLETTNTATKAAQYEIETSESVTKALAYTITSTAAATRLLTYRLTEVLFSRGNEFTLPTNTETLETPYSPTDVANVATDDGVRVCATGEAYVIHQFKQYAPNNNGAITLTWNGQTDLAPSLSPVFFQIYNFNTLAYETIAANTTSAAGVDFTLTGEINTSVVNYYGTDDVVVARIYQEV